MATDDKRVNPDELLKAIKQEDEAKQRGHLKIFFGYAAGVGKTYAMLQAAHAAKARGVDVVVGYVEPHARPETTALLSGLEIVPTKRVSHNGISLKEFDIDAVLLRAPQLVLVDEFAHTNAPGCRHSKRYQDVKELLKAGIDVYTTVNVQHIESLNDMVASVTGVIVRERIPDSVFDGADQVTLVDIEPADLIARLHAGQVYRAEQAHRALGNFFTVENLTALREIALRRCAERMTRLSEAARVKSNRDYYTGEHILVCVSSAPSNPKIIRTAARMAGAFRATFTALYVETPDEHNLSDENRARLQQNIDLAVQLGAKVETVAGDDVAVQISEYARLSGVSKIVMGRTSAKTRGLFRRANLSDRLIELSPNLDIYIIPDTQEETLQQTRERRFHPQGALLNGRDLAITFAVLVVCTLGGLAFYDFGMGDINVIPIYLLGLLIIAIQTSRRLYTLIASVGSILLYNFFFVTPRYTLNVLDPQYVATFGIMFVTAIVASTLTTRLSRHAQTAALTAYRTKVLFDANQMIQQAETIDDIWTVTATQLTKLLDRDVIVYSGTGTTLEEPVYMPADTTASDEAACDVEHRPACLSDNERAVAMWAYKNNKHAGASTSTLPNAHCLYLAVRLNDRVYGVVGIRIDGHPLAAFENSVVLSILGECALALESAKAAKEREEAAVLAKNERLRANLLRSIGHDLRTPLTSISGLAGVLLSSDDLPREKLRAMYADIYDDSLWLNNLVENLLAVTRLEDGTMKLDLAAELVDDVVNESTQHLSREAKDHIVTVHQPEDILLARMDARLIVQVLVNIIDNALKYTPKGSHVDISSRREGSSVVIEVADDGPGIPDAAKARVFDMFYTVNANKPVDNRRSIGLGLALCKSIIAVHGGTICAVDNPPHGTIIRFTLPAEEVPIP